MNDRAFRTQLTRLATGAGFLLSASLVGAPLALAQPDMNREEPESAVEYEPRVERMTRQFDLSAAQQKQISAILEKTRQEQTRLRQETRQKIDAVLTEEQKAKRDKLMTERLERRLDRLSRKLDLTTEQTAKLKTLFEEQQKNPELDRQQVRERMSAILTADQTARLERERMHGPGPDRRGPTDRVDED